ncbi:hypothetical protein SAMN05192574_10395 [Mucilaginibacter gossypiicola]|uniref:Uncharacterized protein n=1 Tax=Mucilaginibacter gossypiicola TaxID=551995 RepID=A0A1H8GCN8_9SPHI|nr:hypothetical protein SAMN05192574_10395 [Mucilaginibacter gossypiicola]
MRRDAVRRLFFCVSELEFMELDNGQNVGKIQ